MQTLRQMYEGGLSIPQIALRTGISRSTVRLKLIDSGTTLRSRADGVRIADGLGSGLRGKKREFTPEWRTNISKQRLAWGKENALGVSLKPNGYLEYTTGPHKGRLVHVVAMEERIGRRLNRSEVVHHCDEVKTNNGDWNLCLMTRADHARHHRLKEQIEQ